MVTAKSNLQFRTATPEDAPAIEQLVQSAFRAADIRQDWTADMELNIRFRIEVDEVMPRITNPDSAIVMAFARGDGGKELLVASLEVTKRSDELARLSMLAVDQHHQRGGIGREILSYAEAYCQKTWGVTKFGLDALSTREALIAWYIRRGYQKTGDTAPFPVDRFSDLALPADLCFVQLEKDLGEASVEPGYNEPEAFQLNALQFHIKVIQADISGNTEHAFCRYSQVLL
ncbi:GNAT family acetyltransferase, putative [Talaromyces stipitatus ATCC 10500]|uniref:GNAT family acetyltransferase, putative n=1 Tax=Talaromyces stipitatus (strain ATCC 10500 / CBS 375.48 / QM 6759 / NRRL 1006) TaxID=441959 RepID=B8M9F6_TALSN|nr:GNAT family acetyltransferase, putative [Talaromyces stipitatus ATCC 10500]EED17716.1 GNAT family acetyltransferase, putative [Talaromyces stipitatus ATCC 10500]